MRITGNIYIRINLNQIRLLLLNQFGESVRRTIRHIQVAIVQATVGILLDMTAPLSFQYIARACPGPQFAADRIDRRQLSTVRSRPD